MQIISGPAWQILVQAFQHCSKPEQTLLLSAWHARQNAYAVYSDYRVGAAVRSAQSGRIYPGCNVECASYSETGHAEENAVHTMISAEGPSVTFDALAIVCTNVALETLVSCLDTLETNPLRDLVMPCGRCRQVLWEHADRQAAVRIYSSLPSGEVAMVDMRHLLPIPFKLQRNRKSEGFVSHQNHVKLGEAL